MTISTLQIGHEYIRILFSGICIDNVDGDFSKYDVDMTVKPDTTPGLCFNDVNDNCCSCFKKQDPNSGCYKARCNIKGKGSQEGICIGKYDPDPVGYTKTEVKCYQKGDCHCWIPCKNIWSEEKCTKKADKGKCNEEEIAANCCDTCQASLSSSLSKLGLLDTAKKTRDI